MTAMAPLFITRVIRQFRNNFFAGAFLLLPIIGSVFIVWKLFDWSDKALPKTLGVHWPPFVGLLVSISIVYFVGLAAKNYFGKKIIATGNAIIVNIPLLNKIYLIIKQIIDTVTVDKKKLFERVVLMEFPHKDSFVVGFVTSESNEIFSSRMGRKLVAVFVPNVPNPTTGFLLYVPEEELTTIDMPVETALKLVVSAGLLGTEKWGDRQNLPSAEKQWNWMDIFKWKSRKTGPCNLHDPRD
jgi:uncharacterized membrane protein